MEYEQKIIKWYPQKKNSRFINVNAAHEVESLLFGTLPSLVQSFFAQWLHRQKYNKRDWSIYTSLAERSKELCITWIGHATFLVQLDEQNILTDPVFFNIFPWFTRLLPLNIALKELPPIDYVLISHNHRDHMDATSLLWLKSIYPKMHVMVPQGNKAWFTSRKFTSVTEYNWWDTYACGNITFACLPAIHWSGRGIFDKNKTLWGSWMIAGQEYTVYFGGDTAFGDHFTQIASEYNAIDCALLPLGPCEPYDWMKRTHMNGADLVKAFVQLNAKYCIPMHWGTFSFGKDKFADPLIQLANAWALITEEFDQTIHLLQAGGKFFLSRNIKN